MKLLIKKYGWIILFLIVIGGLLSIGYDFLQEIFFQKGMEFAKAENERVQAEADARIKVNTDFYVGLIGKAEKDRQDVKAVHEAEIRKYKNNIGYFKSETSEALKAKNATVAQWFAAKQLDEITINLQAEQIEGLDLRVKGLIADWAQSDIDKNIAHKKIIDDWKLKIKSCKDYSDKLEAKLKPSLWKYVKQGVVVISAFALGRMTK